LRRGFFFILKLVKIELLVSLSVRTEGDSYLELFSSLETKKSEWEIVGNLDLKFTLNCPK